MEGNPGSGSDLNALNGSLAGACAGEELENICVNEPGADDGGGAAAGLAGGAALKDGPVWNILVNSPGAEEGGADGGCGAPCWRDEGGGGAEKTGAELAAGAGLSVRAPNICVKLPGEEGGAAGGA